MTGAFWCHFPAELRYGKRAVLANLLWRRLSGGDFIKVMNEYRHPLPPDVARAADLRRVARVPVDPGHYSDQIRLVRDIVDRAGGRYPVFATVLNPFAQMCDTYGVARMAALIAEDTEGVAAALRIVADDLADLARLCVEQGRADGIFLASQGGESGRLDDAAFRMLVAEPDRRILDAAAAVASRTILHICGEGIALSRYRDVDVAAVNWDASNNDAADALWPAAVRMPGLDLRGALRRGDARAIREAARALPAGRDGARGVLAAACSVACDLPFWRMRAALSAANAALPPRPRMSDLLAWHALKGAARLRGAVGRRRRHRPG